MARVAMRMVRALYLANILTTVFVWLVGWLLRSCVDGCRWKKEKDVGGRSGCCIYSRNTVSIIRYICSCKQVKRAIPDLARTRKK